VPHLLGNYEVIGCKRYDVIVKTKTEWIFQTIRLTDELREQLREIGRKKYREENMSRTIRLMIEDAAREINCGSAE
jgi:hypothetical protein